MAAGERREGQVTVSVCIIAHDEEASLPETLSALDWADEIVVVDCESADGTAAVARRFTDRLFSRPNLANLNANKNYAFAQASSEWILCLDADEIVTGELAREIQSATSGDPAENGFFLTRENSWFGRVLKHGGHFPDRQLRLFRRGRGKFPEQHLHERLDVEGEVGMLPTPLGHFPYRTVGQYLRKMDFYTTFEARHRLAEGGSFTVAGFFLSLARAKMRFFRRYILKRGFLDGWQGFAAAYLDFLSRMVVQFKLRELENDEGVKNRRAGIDG
jgi:glycosyltransferase involved in cell wall biosynthesis